MPDKQGAYQCVENKPLIVVVLFIVGVIANSDIFTIEYFASLKAN